MKKLLLCMLIATAFAGLSCKSTPKETVSQANAEPITVGEVTQENIDSELKAIYDHYLSNLDMKGSQKYTVVWGDTLSKITRRYYGDLTDVGAAGSRNGFYYPILMMASPDSHIADPDLIYPGLTLTIIDLKRNLANPEAHQAIKDSIKDIAYVYDVKNKPAEVSGLMKLSNSL
jgi:nucleoid-associated protein YgaU